jgi:GT2 family glycosyltransferase
VKVSVVTPSFQHARFLERTLDSVERQEGVEVEHMVCDAASTDGTVELLRARGARVRWVSEPDAGQADAVNKGIRATDGEIIGWLNSDDVYYPGALAAVRAHFERHPEVDVVYGDADHIDLEDRPFEAYPTEPFDLRRLVQACFLCQPATFFRRRAAERHGLLDARLQYCMDYEYWLRLALAGARFAHLPVKLAGSRLYAENQTLGSRVKVHAEINDMLKRTLGRVPRRWLVNYAYAVVDAEGASGLTRRPRALVQFLRAARRWNGARLPNP